VPDVPLVDTHLLLWDPRRHEMPWLSTDYWTDEESVLAHPYGLAEFDRQREGVEVGGLVFMRSGLRPPTACSKRNGRTRSASGTRACRASWPRRRWSTASRRAPTWRRSSRSDRW